MKTVKLMSPEITDQLYPLSILGESPNHSHIDFAHPDFEQHPLYRQALASQQEFNLQVAPFSASHRCEYLLCDHHCLRSCVGGFQAHLLVCCCAASKHQLPFMLDDSVHACSKFWL